MSEHERDEHHKSFYSWPDCNRCNGTGWVKIAECYCSRCKRRYIKQLERIIASHKDNNDYSNPVTIFAVYKAHTDNEEEQS